MDDKLNSNKKRILHQDVAIDLSQWKYGVSLDQLQNDIERLREAGATHICVTAYYSWGEPFADVDAYTQRIETDEEYQLRIAKITREKEEELAREFEQYRALHKKYGGLSSQ